jgi:hypothetical protein
LTAAQKVEHRGHEVPRAFRHIRVDEAPERMRHHHEAEIRDTPQLRHFLRGLIERIRDDRYRRDAGFLEDDGVEQTARRACPSIADAGNRKVAFAFQLGKLRIG